MDFLLPNFLKERLGIFLKDVLGCRINVQPSVCAAGSGPAVSSVTELVQTLIRSSGPSSLIPATLVTSYSMDIFPGLLQLWDGCVELGSGVPWLAAPDTQADGCPNLPAARATATKGHSLQQFLLKS